MNEFLAFVIVLIILIVVASVTMHLHKYHIINLYTNVFEQVLTFGAYLIMAIILIIPLMTAQTSEDSNMYAMVGFIIATVILIFQSVRINNDIKSIIISIIGNIVWALLGSILVFLLLFILALVFGGDNKKPNCKSDCCSDLFSIFTGK